jgi:hypothetical protein
VKPGDLLGMNDNDTTTPTSTTCGMPSPGNTTSWNNGSAGLGLTETFGSDDPNSVLNIEATFEPQNRFTLAGVTRSKRRGTATIALDLPNSGKLTVSGPGIKTPTPEQTVSAGQAQLLVKARAGKKRKLFTKGRCKVNVAITYTPTGGDARTQHAKFKLVKKL